MAQFEKGRSGNPTGRPLGARSKFSEAFIKELAEDFSEHGKTVIQSCRADRPGEYLRVCASILPRSLPGDSPAIDMGDTTTPPGVVDAMGRIVSGVATGELTTEQAKALSDIVEVQRKAIELNDMELRLREIESRAGINGASSSHTNSQRNACQ